MDKNIEKLIRRVHLKEIEKKTHRNELIMIEGSNFIQTKIYIIIESEIMIKNNQRHPTNRNLP